MPYAMVVVVEAENAEAAYSALAPQASVIDALFVGEPWEVERLAEDDPRSNGQFSTLACIDGHPGA